MLQSIIEQLPQAVDLNGQVTCSEQVNKLFYSSKSSTTAVEQF